MEKYIIEGLINDGQFHIFYNRPKPAKCVSCGDDVIRPWIFSVDGKVVEVGRKSVVIRDLNGELIILDRECITEIQRYDATKRMRRG